MDKMFKKMEETRTYKIKIWQFSKKLINKDLIISQLVVKNGREKIIKMHVR